MVVTEAREDIGDGISRAGRRERGQGEPNRDEPRLGEPNQGESGRTFCVIVVSGPGGVGKGTVVARLLDVDPQLWLSRSWTTRERRPGESPDAYFFKTTAEFQAHIDSGGFLEWAPFLDYMQGSPIPEPPEGTDVLFEIDVQGAGQIKELYPDSLLVFLDAPSREVQRLRMVDRGDTGDRIEARLAKADEELSRARSLGFVEVINDDLTETVAKVEALIREHRGSRGIDRR